MKDWKAVKDNPVDISIFNKVSGNYFRRIVTVHKVAKENQWDVEFDFP